MEPGTVALIVIGLLPLVVLRELMLVGGAVTGTMMGGVIMAASTPVGAILRLIVLILVSLFSYVAFIQ